MTALAVFQPPKGPSFVVPGKWHWPGTKRNFIKEVYSEFLPSQERPSMPLRFVWRDLGRREFEYFLSFFHVRGMAERFLWAPIMRQWSPFGDVPLLDQVAGGSLTQRTYHVRYTWFDATTGEETEASPAASLEVADSFLLSVSLPVFPIAISAARIYASETAGAEEVQAVVETSTWQEPVGGIATGSGALPPQDSNLRPVKTWRLTSDLDWQIIAANRYRVECEFTEQHV